VTRVEIDGRPATAETLVHPALVNYGHVTMMQVRGGRTRGLDKHLARLDAATRELFETGLDGDRVRDHVRHALADTADASVRVGVFQAGAEPSVLVAVRPPAEAPTEAQRLRSVRYERPVPHLKHVGSFGQIYHGIQAERAGFHDALLTGADDVISEAAISNLAAHDGTSLVWPDAPLLDGITMLLLSEALPSRRVRLRLADLPSYAGVFVTNSLGVTPVTRVDDTTLPVDPTLRTHVLAAYDALPWTRL
jgi:branched-subunit amino acid aminotransferase/4-amino-4-deoxychorismate lyase